MSELEKGESEKSCPVAPDGGQARDDSSSESSSSEDERFASPPPNKRRKYKHTYSDPRVDTLAAQVNYISNYVAQLSNHDLPTDFYPSTSNLPSTSSQDKSEFLTNPSLTTTNFATNNTLKLGDININYDENRIIPLANKERLNELNKLQQFDSQAWKGIRYKKAMQTFVASPGFMGLKINEELCHFNKSKDYLASTETLMASLSSAVLEQRHLVQSGLQDILDWAAKDTTNLNVNNLFEKFSTMFGPGSDISKNSEVSMQIICGKRAECIELRRDRILKEIGNANVRATLQNIPPSSEYLFSRDALQPIIQSLGGSHTWLNTPSYLIKKKPNNSFDQNSFKKHNKQTYHKNNNSNKNERKPKYVPKKPFRRNNYPEQSNANSKQN